MILRSLPPKSIFLLPSYLCESIIQPFKQENIFINYFPVKKNLEIDIDKLNKLLKNLKPTGIFLINYFGYPLSSSEKNFLLDIKDKITIIEDCTHGSFIEYNRPKVGTLGHYVITSFRKCFPVPDGALVINRTNNKLPKLQYSETVFLRYRLLGKMLRNEFIKYGNAAIERIYLKLFQQAEEFINNFEDIVTISNFH